MVSVGEGEEARDILLFASLCILEPQIEHEAQDKKDTQDDPVHVLRDVHVEDFAAPIVANAPSFQDVVECRDGGSRGHDALTFLAAIKASQFCAQMGILANTAL